MMQLLVDTSAYSAFKRDHPRVKAAIQQAERLLLNPIVIGELWAGFRRGQREQMNREELGTFISSPRVSILPLDEQTAERYAIIVDTLRKAGTPLPANDIWIAASAMQHGVHVLTTDGHFKHIPQIIPVFVEIE